MNGTALETAEVVAKLLDGNVRRGSLAYFLPAEGGVLAATVESVLEVPDFLRTRTSLIAGGQLWSRHDTHATEWAAVSAALASATRRLEQAQADVVRFASQKRQMQERLDALEALARPAPAPAAMPVPPSLTIVGPVWSAPAPGRNGELA
jgi:hypothetical protein